MLQLKKFPDISVSTREEARESRPHPEVPRFRLLAREEGSFPCVLGKEFPASRRISRGGALHRKGERNSRVVPPFPETPDVSVHSRENCFPFTVSIFSRGSTHTTVSRGKALWESLVGKPRGKASRESHRSLDPSERKRHTAATAQEESARACLHSRRGLTPLGRPQKYPKNHVGRGEESSGSGTDSTQGLRTRHRRGGIPRGPRATRMGTGLS